MGTLLLEMRYVLHEHLVHNGDSKLFTAAVHWPVLVIYLMLLCFCSLVHLPVSCLHLGRMGLPFPLRRTRSLYYGVKSKAEGNQCCDDLLNNCIQLGIFDCWGLLTVGFLWALAYILALDFLRSLKIYLRSHFLQFSLVIILLLSLTSQYYILNFYVSNLSILVPIAAAQLFLFP